MDTARHARSFAVRPRRSIYFVLATLVIGTAAWLISAPRPALSGPERAEFGNSGDARNGQLIFAAADCASCHASPGQPDRLRLGGGLALASPFGTLRVPNISPDPGDGIGSWTAADLANALLTGVSPAGKHYYPALPYTSYTHMRPSDVRDLMAYLRTLPPVQGRPPPHDIAFPLNIRRFVGFWKLLYLDSKPLREAPERGAAWNRGRYLVEALAHCAECHSSRNVIGGIESWTRFAGGEDPEGAGFAPNITPTGLPGWSRADLATFLRTGTTPDVRTVGSSMAGVLTNTALLPEADRQAIATYVLSLPGRPTSQP